MNLFQNLIFFLHLIDERQSVRQIRKVKQTVNMFNCSNYSSTASCNQNTVMDGPDLKKGIDDSKTK